MHLFKGRWQTGLYTLFKCCVFEKFKQYQTRAWTANKYSWPTRWHALRTQTSVLYWAPHSWTQLLYIHRPTLGFKLHLHIFPCHILCCALNLRHAICNKALRWSDAGMILAGNIRFFVSIQRIKFPFSSVILITFPFVDLWWTFAALRATHWMSIYLYLKLTQHSNFSLESQHLTAQAAACFNTFLLQKCMHWWIYYANHRAICFWSSWFLR